MGNAGIFCIDPLGYLDFMALVSGARIILTDSGGIQEETTTLGIPCVTLRENTERPITVTHGTNPIVRDCRFGHCRGRASYFERDGAPPAAALVGWACG